MLRRTSQSLMLLCFVIVTLEVARSDAYKILMIPYGNKSHLIEFHGLGQVLLNRGHQVYFYLSKVDTPPSEIAKAGYKFIHPDVEESLMPMWFDEADIIDRIDMSLLENFLKSRQESEVFVAKVKRVASIMLEEKQIEAIRRENFDFMLIDSMSFWYFTYLIPYKLGVPYGGLTTMFEPIRNRVPHFPSVYPDAGFSTHFGVKPGLLGSSFADRFKNFVAVAFHELYMRGTVDEFFERDNISLQEVTRGIAPHFVDQHYLLSDPLPTTSSVRLVGGLVTRPSKPLTDAKILHFVQSTSHPIVVCSFGTMMNSLKSEIVSKLLEAFRQVPQYKVLMRLKGAQLTNVPDNVLILDWLPQNDLLAHNKTALLITHSGNNGQNEAVYHGIPMVAFYVFGDQEHNADRVDRRGYGVKLNLLSFSSDELAASMREVIENDKYRKTIGKASEIFRLENAGETAADLIEHVIKYGSEHLRHDEAFELTITEYLMLDIVWLLFAVLSLFAFVAFSVLLKIFKFLL